MTAPPAFASASPTLWAQLLAFQLLPSRQLHPARTPAWQDELQALGPLADQPALQRLLHQRWSAGLLVSWGSAAAPVPDLSHPAWVLALLPPELLNRLVRRAGLLLLGAELRRTVLRTQVLAMHAAFGVDALHWVRHQAFDVHPGLTDGHQWLTEHTPAHYQRAADALGTGLLAQSWQDAPADLQHHADCRLPPEADRPGVRTASGLDAAQARALCLQLLASLESTWLSSFPATH